MHQNFQLKSNNSFNILLLILILFLFICIIYENSRCKVINIYLYNKRTVNKDIKAEIVSNDDKDSPENIFEGKSEYENITFDKINDTNETFDDTGLEDDVDYKIRNGSIFFHETSENGELSIRQACCVESCARVNSESQIYVIFSSTINVDAETIKKLSTFGNINFISIDIESYAKRTPMETFNTSILSKSPWPIEVTSDALRYLTLYKFGGIYLDLDVMVVRPLWILGKNWISREHMDLGSAAMAFGNDKLGRYVADKAIRNFVRRFKIDSYVNNGPLVIKRVLNHLCRNVHNQTIRIKTELMPEHTNCNGFKIYSSLTFSSVSFFKSKDYFRGKYLKTSNIPKKLFGYHMFNFVTKEYKIKKDSFYAKLSRKYCPTVYQEFIREFSF